MLLLPLELQYHLQLQEHTRMGSLTDGIFPQMVEVHI